MTDSPKKHGGARAGAGRPTGRSPYGEATQLLRIPTSQLPLVTRLITSPRRPSASLDRQVTVLGVPSIDPPRVALPLMRCRVSAGFPSPADDYVEARLDLNEFLIKEPEATFFVRAEGLSMIQAGIHDGDVLVVNRALEPVHRKIVVASVNGAFTVKRLFRQPGKVMLVAENPDFAPIEFNSYDELVIWGVVTSVIRQV